MGKIHYLLSFLLKKKIWTIYFSNKYSYFTVILKLLLFQIHYNGMKNAANKTIQGIYDMTRLHIYNQYMNNILFF